ncbi:MAG: hypothetical protein SWY16_03865 [Cyanobacteriota bacterium]|nr:hypothetical protein [Cyanobacteriota bacterium]
MARGQALSYWLLAVSVKQARSADYFNGLAHQRLEFRVRTSESVPWELLPQKLSRTQGERYPGWIIHTSIKPATGDYYK